MSAPHDFTTVPDGTYTVAVREVREGRTARGDVRWALALEVAAGDFEGRLAAWDAIVWSARGRARARRVLRALGVECDPTTRPTDLLGHRACVEVRRASFLAADGETEVLRSEVPYDGWSVAGGAP